MFLHANQKAWRFSDLLDMIIGAMNMMSCVFLYIYFLPNNCDECALAVNILNFWRLFSYAVVSANSVLIVKISLYLRNFCTTFEHTSLVWSSIGRSFSVLSETKRNGSENIFVYMKSKGVIFACFATEAKRPNLQSKRNESEAV